MMELLKYKLVFTCIQDYTTEFKTRRSKRRSKA